ncbi:MAG: hypothetical protein KKA73_31315 [Chloroflexi bacterium]|nr:hypothetical protein [Chloroflexota bacterium]MBU1752192.1 hypothetical protein [Chloroflexota bacterium]
MRRIFSARIGLLLVALVATVLAVVVGWYATQQFERLVVTRPFVVTQATIEPYTLITSAMLAEQDLPASLAQQQAVYVRREDVVGQMTTTRIGAGSLIYRDQVVAPARFRYAAADREIISVPVDPAKAIAGQIRVGQRVNIYRLAWSNRAASDVTPAELLGQPGGATEILVQGALVVDVRSTKGEPAGNVTLAGESALEAQAIQGPSSSTTGTRQYPLTILVLAVAPDEAQALTQLMAELHANYDLWVTLAPVGDDE